MWPGRYLRSRENIKDICQDTGLEGVNNYEVSKEKVTEIIFHHHYKVVKKEEQN